MALKFKSKEDISGVTSTAKSGKDVSIAQTGAFDEDILSKPLGEIIDSGESPRKIVEKVEKWCPMLNAQTVIGHKNISKIKSKPYFLPIFNILSEKKPQKFVIKDVIKWLNAEKYTEGDVQRKVLASLICRGYVKKVREKYKKKDKKESAVKDYFCWNEKVTPCRFLKDDCCSLNWRDAEETNLYVNQYMDNSDEEDN